MRNAASHFLLAALLLLTGSAYAQGQKMPEDKSKRPSPPATATAMVGGATVTIDYSRPAMKGRKVFGGLVPYNAVWRTGANEATTFTVDKPVKIEGQALPAGKYALFAIPGATEWTIVFNKTANQWGAYEYDAKQDALRVKVKAKKTAAPVEQFTITADKAGKVSLMWENSQADFMVK
ncbi:DUF2911 domain-containing protein [Hymenobacter algoricola]|uniref:DUF2911 domain-containing protein n=1 Tax=Hymenobacter algoricola TaxID=486267 RepID=A0ABP7N8V0_9BACT